MGAISRRYTAEEIDRALLALAIYGGNSKRTSRALAEQGLKVGHSRLRAWRNDTYPDRYLEICDKHARQVEEVIVTEAREVAFKAAEVERLALDVTAQQLKDGTVKDASTAARNASVVKGVNMDQVLKLSGRPTVITETRSIEDILRRLNALAPGVVTVDSFAEELPPAEESPPTPSES